MLTSVTRIIQHQTTSCFPAADLICMCSPVSWKVSKSWAVGHRSPQITVDEPKASVCGDGCRHHSYIFIFPHMAFYSSLLVPSLHDVSLLFVATPRWTQAYLAGHWWHWWPPSVLCFPLDFKPHSRASRCWGKCAQLSSQAVASTSLACLCLCPASRSSPHHSGTWCSQFHSFNFPYRHYCN